MKLSLFKVLLVVIALTIALFLIEFYLPVTALRAILGIPFVLFFPGFVLISAIIPGRDDINTSTRIILSFVTSILADAAIGLALNYTPFGITANSVIISMSGFTIFFALIGMAVQLALPVTKKTVLDFSLRFYNPTSGALNISLSVIMAVVIVGALGSVTYFALAPKSDKPFTQFYILNHGANLYSLTSTDGGNGVSVTLGIKNNEGGQVNYRVQALVNNTNLKEINPISLANGQKWESSIELPVGTGTRSEIEFQLFKNDDTEPYLESLRFWVDLPAAEVISR